MSKKTTYSTNELDRLENAVVRGGKLLVSSCLGPSKVRARRRVRGTLVNPKTGEALLDPKGKQIQAKSRTTRDELGVLRVSYTFPFDRVPKGSPIATHTQVRRSKAPLLAIPCMVMVALVVGMLLWHDPNARKGNYEGKTPEEISRDLDDEVDWWSMEVSIKPYITLAAGQTLCEARIENVAANHCDQTVTLSLAETGETLYQSGAIHPGEYVQNIQLSRPLDVGVHEVLATFQGYEQNLSFGANGSLIGHERFGASCSAQIQIACQA